MPLMNNQGNGQVFIQSSTPSWSNGDLWYDTANNLFKYNENGTTRTFEKTSNKNAASGYAPLDASSLLPLANLTAGTYATLGSATLSAATHTITLSVAKKNLIVIVECTAKALSDQISMRFNADTGANYLYYQAAYPSALSQGTSSNGVPIEAAATAGRTFLIAKVRNIAAHNKDVVCFAVQDGNNYDVCGGSWTNTSDQITSVTIRTNSGNNMSGGTAIVLGMDE